MSVEKQGSGAKYALGHSEHEVQRLENQGEYLSGLTREFLIRAGLGAGMRVLDYGAGAGDVSFLASEIVGPTGEVVGLDRVEAILEKARARAEQRGIRNVRFAPGDETAVASIAGGQLFDAVIGRLVLVHQRDRVAALRAVMAQVRPGGIVAFQEIDMDSRGWSEPRLPVLEQSVTAICETLRHGGVYVNTAIIARAFEAAGVEDRHLVYQGQVEDGSRPLAHLWISEMIRTILPVADKTGMEIPAQLRKETLGELLAAEAKAAGAHWIPIHWTMAWGRVPGRS